MADEYTFASSLADQDTDFQFDTRQFVYIADQNNGSYPNSQVTFDLAGLSNSGKFVDWKQSFLTIPLVLNVNATAGAFAAASAENNFAASLKNSVFQLISSMSVQLTNNDIVNLTNFSNLDINYKILNRLSTDEVENLAPSILFSKDSAESITHISAASAQGLGECNNTIAQTLFSPTGGWGTTSYLQNKGRADRMKYTSFDASNNKFTTNSLAGTVGKNFCSVTTTNITYYITATLPMRFLHDVFDKLPLMRGAYYRLLLNLNAQSQVVCDLASTGTTYSTVSVTSPNNQLPFMLSPLGAGSGFVAAGTATQITASLGIAKSLVPSGTFSHPTINQCRVYACCYTMSPIYEEKYLSMVPTKTVRYNDILSFQQLAVGAGSNVNWLVTNGVSRMRSLVVYPFISSIVNGSNPLLNQTTFTAGKAAGSPLNSPFSSAPATCAPFHNFSNFNVLLSGSALYQSNFQYKFETFLQENRASLGLNGGLSTGLSSGLIGQSDFENGYGFAYVDLSRKISQASDDVSRSVQLVFTNNSSYQVDYICIINYEREITVSTSTGSLVI